MYSRKRKKNALRKLLDRKEPFQLNFRKLKMSFTCITLRRLGPTANLAQRFIPFTLAQNAIKNFHITVVLHF